ncbi:MAG: hypothetical protein Q7U47_10785 [Paludibacter sp.]|nr:hypothetical protein [Paludibacter sp.]
MKTIEQTPTLTKDLRANLKSIVETELNQLPETLAALPPDKRLEVLLKLLPFILPKVESVGMTKGEPTSWELD